MKRTLLLSICALMIASAASADHIGIFSDASGTSCNLGPIAGQFSATATVIHKFAVGAVGSLFNITFPPGSTFFQFNSPYYACDPGPCTGQISLGYGQCRSDSIVLGTLLAIYGTGTLSIVPADGQASVRYADCSFQEHDATGGQAYVGTGGECPPFAVEPSTWGSVKALYR